MRHVAAIGLLVMVAMPVVATAQTDSRRINIECDPLPFALGGYGCQIGHRGPPLPGVRFSVASFSLDAPDAVTELNGNEGFHLRVRPSVAAYALYYLGGTAGGWTVGGSLRYLRLEYTHDDAPGSRARVGDFSIEAIGGYKWHPFAGWFYVQPWVAVARTLAERGEATVGNATYSAMPVQLFFTVNVGWELVL